MMTPECVFERNVDNLLSLIPDPVTGMSLDTILELVQKPEKPLHSRQIRNYNLTWYTCKIDSDKLDLVVAGRTIETSDVHYKPHKWQIMVLDNLFVKAYYFDYFGRLGEGGRPQAVVDIFNAITKACGTS